MVCEPRECLGSRLLSEPIIEHRAREADMPPDSIAGQAASSHGLIDPARLDVQVPSGLLRAKQSILGRGGRWQLRCWCSHTHTDPRVLGSAKGISCQRSCHFALPLRPQKAGLYFAAGYTPAPPTRPSREIAGEIVGRVRSG
jgi:hypothetical protein